MYPGSNVRCFPQGKVFLPVTAPHRPNHDQTCMDPYTQSELDALFLLQTGMQVCHRSEDTQTRSHCAVRVIFMGLGIAEIDKQTIPEQLGNMSFIALDDFCADVLVCTYHVPIVFRIELS